MAEHRAEGMALVRGSKTERAAEAVAQGYNLTQAAEAAGISYGTMLAYAREQSFQDRVSELRRQSAERTGLTLDAWAKELREMLALDPGELFNEEMQLRSLRELTPAQRRMISEVNPNMVNGVQFGYKIKFYSRKDLMEMWAKHCGAYEADNRQRRQVAVIVGEGGQVLIDGRAPSELSDDALAEALAQMAVDAEYSADAEYEEAEPVDAGETDTTP
jgi:hypothetical protein